MPEKMCGSRLAEHLIHGKGANPRGNTRTGAVADGGGVHPRHAPEAFLRLRGSPSPNLGKSYDVNPKYFGNVCDVVAFFVKSMH